MAGGHPAPRGTGRIEDPPHSGVDLRVVRTAERAPAGQTDDPRWKPCLGRGPGERRVGNRIDECAREEDESHRSSSTVLMTLPADRATSRVAGSCGAAGTVHALRHVDVGLAGTVRVRHDTGHDVAEPAVEQERMPPAEIAQLADTPRNIGV